jgi:hypothetical protein
MHEIASKAAPLLRAQAGMALERRHVATDVGLEEMIELTAP